MLKKSKIFLSSFLLLALCLVGEIFYLQSSKVWTNRMLNNKKSFVKLTGLPDLAIANESRVSRHRSLHTIADIYEVDGTLREFDRLSFVLNHAGRL